MTEDPVTHWIDTNVMLEVYSDGDLQEAAEKVARGEGAWTAVEDRRLRLQGSLWMAMALCSANVRTVTYEHENLRNILRLAPPDSPRGAWTAVVLYMLGEHGVFDGWDACMTNDGATLSDRDRDRHMVKECVAHKLVLVTRDAKVTREARARGVDAGTPEEFAERHLDRNDACRMFGERLRDAAMGYLVAGPTWEHEMRTEKGQIARQLFAAVWRPPSIPGLT